MPLRRLLQWRIIIRHRRSSQPATRGSPRKYVPWLGAGQRHTKYPFMRCRPPMLSVSAEPGFRWPYVRAVFNAAIFSKFTKCFVPKQIRNGDLRRLHNFCFLENLEIWKEVGAEKFGMVLSEFLELFHVLFFGNLEFWSEIALRLKRSLA